MPASTFPYVYLPNSSIDADSPVDDILMDTIRNDIQYNYEYTGGQGPGGAGTGGGFVPDNANIAHNHDGFNSALTNGELLTLGDDHVLNTVNLVGTGFNLIKSLNVTYPAYTVDPITIDIDATFNFSYAIGGGGGNPTLQILARYDDGVTITDKVISLGALGATALPAYPTGSSIFSGVNFANPATLQFFVSASAGAAVVIRHVSSSFQTFKES